MNDQWGFRLINQNSLFILKGRIQEAEMSLRRLRGSDYNIKAELCRIEAQVMQDVAQDPRFSDLFRPTLYKPILIGIGLMIFQQACGINAALFNSVEIFRLSGSSLDGVVSAVILNVILVRQDIMNNISDRQNRLKNT